MKNNSYGELVVSESDLVDIVMQGRDLGDLKDVTVDQDFVIGHCDDFDLNLEFMRSWRKETCGIPLEQYDWQNQKNWHMPEVYKNLDIAEYLLSLCSTPEQLQRVGQELLLFQDRELFDLLRYLKYLVDTMRQANVIWGVGRGSSVASYCLYLLGVHRVDSLYYDLDPGEFLR